MKDRLLLLIGCILGFTLLCFIIDADPIMFFTCLAALLCGYTIGIQRDAVHAISETKEDGVQNE